MLVIKHIMKIDLKKNPNSSSWWTILFSKLDSDFNWFVMSMMAWHDFNILVIGFIVQGIW